MEKELEVYVYVGHWENKSVTAQICGSGSKGCCFGESSVEYEMIVEYAREKDLYEFGICLEVR